MARLCSNPAPVAAKAVLKPHALQALRDCRTTQNLAKRLECVRVHRRCSSCRHIRTPATAPSARHPCSSPFQKKTKLRQERRLLRPASRRCRSYGAFWFDRLDSTSMPRLRRLKPAFQDGAPVFKSRARRSESGAKATRTPDASRLPDDSEPREAFRVRACSPPLFLLPPHSHSSYSALGATSL